jgi:hypothetical protein
MVHWLWIHVGLNSGNSPWYLFPSGWGGILLVSGSILTAPYVAWKRHCCEVHRCWRLGRHGTAAGHTVCRRHHPDGAPSHADVLAAHLEARDAQHAAQRGRRTPKPNASSERMARPEERP